MAKQLVTLDNPVRVQKLADGEDKSSAKWQLLFPVGVTKFRPDFPGGSIVFDAAFLASLESNFKRLSSEYKGADAFALQVNYNHPDGDAPIESLVAAGWIEDFQAREDGGWALIRWTDRARSHIEADEFRCLSPEFLVDARNSNTGKRQGPTLLGAALLNTPFLKELPRVAAGDMADEAEGVDMDKKAICAALGLPEETADEAVLEALSKLVAATKAAEATEAKLGALSEAGLKLADDNKSLSGQVAALTAQVQKFESEAREANVDALMSELVSGGKIIAAQKDGLKKLALSAGVEAVRAVYEKAAPVVEMGERGTSAGRKDMDSAEASKRINELADKLKSEKGIGFADAHRLASAQLVDEARIAFGG